MMKSFVAKCSLTAGACALVLSAPAMAGVPGHLNAPLEVGLVLAQAASGLPSAQDSSSPAQPGSAPKQMESAPLEEVLITATRFFRPVLSASAAKIDLPIVDTPQALSVINSDVLSTFNITNISQLSKFSAGLSNLSDNIGERPNFVSRGYILDLFDGYKLNGISYVPDQNIDPIALSRIEVLKGPTGVTYGRNSYGGAINFIVKTPLQDVSNFVEVATGDRGFGRASADTTLSIKESVLALRLPFAYEVRDAQATPGLKSVTFAPSIAWTPADDLTVTLTTLYQDINSGLSYGLSAMTPEIPTQGPADFNPCSSVTRCVSPPDHLRSHEYSPDWDFAKSKSTNIHLTTDYRLSDRLKLSVNGSHSEGSFDSDQLYAFAPMAADHVTSFYMDRVYFRTNGDSAEVNLTGDFDMMGGVHKFYVGVDYRKYRRFEQNTSANENFYALVDLDDLGSGGSFQDYLNANGLLRPNFVVDGLDNSVRTYKGVGAQMLLDLPASLKMLLGARFEDVELESDWTPVSGLDLRNDFRLPSSQIIPRASLIYEIGPHANLYASYTEGYVPQNGRERGGATIAPETGKQYEVGIKAEFFDRKLLATVAAYDLKREGVAIRDPDNVPGETFVIGGQTQTNKGLELELIGQLAPGLSIAAAASVISAKLGNGVASLANTFVPGVPKRSLSAFLTYETRPGEAGNWTLSGGAAHVGEQFGTSTERWPISAYTVVDAAIGFQLTDSVRIKLIGNNLLDELYVSTIGTAFLFAQFGEPRTVKLVAELHF